MGERLLALLRTLSRIGPRRAVAGAATPMAREGSRISIASRGPAAVASAGVTRLQPPAWRAAASLRVGQRLMGSFLVVIGVFGAVTAVSIAHVHAVGKSYHDLTDHSYPTEVAASRAQTDLWTMMASVRGMMLTGQDDNYAAARQDLLVQIQQVATLVSSQGSRTAAEYAQEQQAAMSLTAQAAAMTKSLDATFAAADSGNNKQALAMHQAALPQLTATLQSLGDFVSLENRLNQADMARAQTSLLEVQALQVVLSLIAALIGVSFALGISRSITHPLGQLVTAARRMTDGDLTVQAVQATGRDEVAELAGAFNHMLGSLRDIISQVTRTSRSVARASGQLTGTAEQGARAVRQVSDTVGQVADDNGSQSDGVAEAARTMAELRAAIDQIARGSQEQAVQVNQAARTLAAAVDSVQRMAGGAEKVAVAANDALLAAQKGGDTVERTVSGMARIKDTVLDAADKVRDLGQSSKRIGEITRVIQDIAGQTHLLSLNAAIEAARAGEHGRGFAVVASAVRQLAERSATPAKEISGLIQSIQAGTAAVVQSMERSTTEVATGGELAAQTGAALGEILEAMRRTHEQIQTIHAAAREVADGSIAASQAMDVVAAVTEESTAASQQMAASSDQVDRTIRQVAEVSRGTAAASQSVSATAEEVNGAISGIADSAKALADMARELEALVTRFRLEEAA